MFIIFILIFNLYTYCDHHHRNKVIENPRPRVLDTLQKMIVLQPTTKYLTRP